MNMSPDFENMCRDYESGYQKHHAHFMEKPSIDLNDYFDYLDEGIAEGEPEFCCSGCMHCLGLYWKDFL